ncbi:hypothetical protein IFR05_016002 [Cadophora sp. M221]|nr:hypothetical protein IFR05_016002 [Cadophora sp. M221]
MPNAWRLGWPKAASNDFNPNDPADWFRKRAEGGAMMPSSFPSPEEARLEARTKATSILSNYHLLGQILDRHEAAIRKRWLKRTKKQQILILLQAWPNMAPSHRPDSEALGREKSAPRPKGVTIFRDWFLWPAVTLEDLSWKRNSSEYPTTVALAIERQYCAQIAFDCKKMRSIIGAKRAEAEDHIRSLREDPSYFADTIIESSEHRPERLPDTNGEDHPFGPKVTQNHAMFWERVIAVETANSYGSLINRNIIEKQLKVLQTFQEKYISVLSPTKTLPREYLYALLAYRDMLTEAQDPVKISRFGFSDLLDQLEHLIIDDPSLKVWLSAKVTRLISDFGTIAQLSDELENYHPWATGMQYESEKVHEQLEKQVLSRISARQVIDSNMKYASTGLGVLGAPVASSRDKHKRFYYPSENRRTEENHEAMRQAEAELDAFWAKFDLKYKYKVGKTINEIVEGFLFENRDLKRTPEWVESTTLVTKKSKKEALEKSFSRFDLDTNDSTSSKVATSTREKIKTKGQAKTLQADPAELEPQPVQEDTQPRFSVDQRFLKVFKTIFFTPNQTDTPGEIPWADFLHAMDKTGFRIEKLYGSVWHFEPTKLDVERDINFHEPHPHSKIPYKIARRMGRRLARAYGWHVGMFALR